MWKILCPVVNSWNPIRTKVSGLCVEWVLDARVIGNQICRPDASLFITFPLSSAHAQVPISICRRFRLRAGNLCFCSEPAINLAFRAERSLWRHHIRGGCFVLLLKQNTHSRLLPTYLSLWVIIQNAWRTSRWSKMMIVEWERKAARCRCLCQY
jgi:hypothetical protein